MCLPLFNVKHSSFTSRVKIYSIKVTKTVGGGAAKCLDCPVGMKEEG